MTDRPTVALLTDFGLEDVYVGVMKAVIWSRCSADIIDLTHEVRPQDVAHAAYLLSTARSFLPPGTITVCVVDPGVGTDRAPIAVQTPEGWFVGPDNGWITSVMREAQLGAEAGNEGRLPESWRAVTITSSAYQLPNVSNTFHGRDVFAPAAAALASGIALEELGLRVDTLVTIDVDQPTRTEHGVRGRIVHIDHFGNLITDIPLAFLPERFTVSIGGGRVEGPAATYQSSEPVIALAGSGDRLEIAAPNGSAAQLIGSGVGDTVTVVPHQSGGDTA